jgi:hypothetical protein
MQSFNLASEERKNLNRKMKRERQPSRRLRMHIVLLCAEGRSPTEIGRVLFCSRTTVYAVVARFVREGQAAFNDRTRRGPKPPASFAFPGSPESNPVESVWWSLHEAVSRNHECSGLDDFLKFAGGYFEEQQPFRLELGEVYERLDGSPP